jgi:hypothetical protein
MPNFLNRKAIKERNRKAHFHGISVFINVETNRPILT